MYVKVARVRMIQYASVDIYYFFVESPQNEFSRPTWKSRNTKYITLPYIEYSAASMRAAKSHFAASG